MMDYEELRQEIIDQNKDYLPETVKDYEQAKELILPRLINAEMNKMILENRPHVMESDLAVTFEVKLNITENGAVSYPITNEMMAAYGVDESELLQVAIKNMEERQEPLLMGLSELLENMVGMETAEEVISELPEGKELMYVLSNTEKLNGASMILSDKAMDMVAEKIGQDFYMIPSSIHEFILVPNDENLDRDSLNAMLTNTNAEEVPLQEQLSDHIYQYSYDSHELVLGDLSAERVQDKNIVADEPAAEKPKMQEITLKFGKGLVGEPFTAKDGKEYVSIKIPNQDKADTTPWASFVVRANAVHDNQYGKGVWVKLPAEGSTTVSKPVLVGKTEDGKNRWENQKTKVANKDLKHMMESYKEKTSLKDRMEQKKEQVAKNKAAAMEKTPERPKGRGNEL